MRWRHTFQTRIAGVLALLLLVVVAATYFFVKTATARAVENQAQVQLKTGSQVFERLLDLRGRRLQYGLDWLTVDLPFKQAVADGKTVPILAALRRHGTGIRSSEVFVLGLDGKVMVSTLPIFTRGQFFPYDDALRHARRTGLQMLIVAMDGRPYLLVQDEVIDELPIARIVMGFPMDKLFANELRSMSNLEVSFLSVQDGQPGPLFSTQPDAYQAAPSACCAKGTSTPNRRSICSTASACSARCCHSPIRATVMKCGCCCKARWITPWNLSRRWTGSSSG